MKKLFTVLAVIFVILLGIFFAKNIIIKTVLEKGVSQVTGLKLSIGKLDIAALKTSVGIHDLVLYNPEGYPDQTMIHFPEIFVDYNFKPFLQGKVDLDQVTIDLKEFYVVRDKNGKLNLDELTALADKGDTGNQEKKPETTEKKPSKQAEIQIDSLKLKVGTVWLKDYSKGAKPDIKEFKINIDEEFTNITDPNSLVKIIVFKALAKTSISSLVNFDVAGLGESLGGSLLKTGQFAIDGVGKTTDVLQGTASGVTDTLKDTKDMLKDTLKNPFGKK